MDLAQIADADLQARNVELLRTLDGLRAGVPHPMTQEACIVEKQAIQRELRSRGVPIKAEVRRRTPESAALMQGVSNANAADLLAENIELKARLAKLEAKQ